MPASEHSNALVHIKNTLKNRVAWFYGARTSASHPDNYICHDTTPHTMDILCLRCIFHYCRLSLEKQKKKSISPLLKNTFRSRSRRRVVVRVQVSVFGVRILCRVRISGRFGRVVPDFGRTKQSPTLPPWLRARS